MEDVTQDDRPIWFLDVDGVLNAIVLAPAADFVQTKASPGGDYGKFTITYNPAIIERIRDLHVSGDVRIMWLTTWGSFANGELREQLDLPELEVADEPPLMKFSGGYVPFDDDGFSWWKLRTVARFYEENPKRRLVWTDDDIALEPEAREFVKNKRILAIAPAQAKALTMFDINKITEFIYGQRQGSLTEAVRL